MAVDFSQLTYDASASTDVQVVTTNSDNVTVVSSDPSWLTATYSAGLITVNVSENNDPDRNATLTITGCDGDIVLTIPVSQFGAVVEPCTATATVTELEFGAAVSSQEFSLNTNTTEAVSVTSSDESWLTASYAAGVVTVSVTENTATQREATITIQACADQPAIVIPVTQLVAGAEPCELQAPIALASFEATLGSQSYIITDNDFEVSDDQEWITATKTENGIEISVLVNDETVSRTGVVTLTGCRTVTIDVEQAAADAPAPFTGYRYFRIIVESTIGGPDRVLYIQDWSLGTEDGTWESVIEGDGAWITNSCLRTNL